MENIELVIKIPEELKEALDNAKKENAFNYIRVYDDTIYNALKNSIPLPKGHGDLIDRNEIEYLKAIHDLTWGKITSSECATKIINSAPTIIEADRSIEDGNND